MEVGAGDFERMIGLDSSTLVILKRLYAPENLGGPGNFLKVALWQIVNSTVKAKLACYFSVKRRKWAPNRICNVWLILTTFVFWHWVNYHLDNGDGLCWSLTYIHKETLLDRLHQSNIRILLLSCVFFRLLTDGYSYHQYTIRSTLTIMQTL